MAFDKDHWKPNPKQAEFLSIPTTIREAFIGGSNGFGKSDVLLMYAIVHRWHENPRFKQVFSRRTFPELKNEIVPRSQEIYPKFGATFNRSEMCWTFPRLDQFGSGYSNNGARIFLAHCEDENDVHKYDSMEINLYTPDELPSFTEYIYLYIAFTRVRTSDPLLPAIVRGAGTPGGVGHSFVKKRFVDPCPEGGSVIVGRGGNKRIYIHATLADNPHIDPGYRQALEALPEAEKRAKLHGDWDAFKGQVFDEFRDKKYPDEPENALHVIEEFEIPEWWPRIVVGDWGMRAMTWVGFTAISPTKRLYIYREMAWTGVKIEMWAPYVKEYIDKENPRLVRFCKSAGQDRGQEHTIQEQIASALNHEIELTTNTPGSRVAGKVLLHEYLRWRKKPIIPANEMPEYNEDYAMRLYRLKGEVAYNKYLELFSVAKEEPSIPKLQIFNSCPILIEALKTCTYEKPKNNKPAEDVAEFEGDDPYDGIRYIVDAAESYFKTAQDEMIRFENREKMVNQLNNTQDYTAFYRNMRKFDSAGITKPVSRFHKARVN